jgi:tRNA (cmo5U34)-methyltransferase
MTRVEDAFGRHAEAYDQQQQGLRPLMDLLHAVLVAGLMELPTEAKILVAGAGTGAEVRMLARRFPTWRFTLVDPSAPMLAVAKRHAEAEGFVDRCTFHHGFVSSRQERGFDAATSILVSHFLTDATERQAYFEAIAARLQPSAPLFNADLCARREDPAFDVTMDLWLRIRQGPSDSQPTPANNHAPGSDFRAVFGTKVAVHGPEEVEAMMRRAGFTEVTLCCQALLIRGWLARRG